MTDRRRPAPIHTLRAAALIAAMTNRGYKVGGFKARYDTVLLKEVRDPWFQNPIYSPSRSQKLKNRRTRQHNARTRTMQ